jgi:hypothetical protein
VSSTPQEVHDQREETTKKIVESIKSLASECKNLSDRSTHTYEPRRGSRSKEAGNVVTGGATSIIFIAGADEVAHCSGKNEEIPREVHSTTTYHFHPR